MFGFVLHVCVCVLQILYMLVFLCGHVSLFLGAGAGAVAEACSHGGVEWWWCCCPCTCQFVQLVCLFFMSALILLARLINTVILDAREPVTITVFLPIGP